MRKYESIRNTRTTQRAIHHILSTNTSKLLKFFFRLKENVPFYKPIPQLINSK